MKHVNDNVYEVEQCPPPCRDSLDMMGAAPLGLDALRHALGEGADMGVGCARGNDEEIRCVADLPEVQDTDIDRLVIIERADHAEEIPMGVGADRVLGRVTRNRTQASKGAGSSIW